MKKLLIGTLIIGGFTGSALVSDQLFSVAASEVEEVEEREDDWNWEEHRNQMGSHMNSMHGSRGRRQSDRFRDREELTEEEWNEQQELMEERHNSMWEKRNEAFENDELDDEFSPGNRFFNNRRQHMTGFNFDSFEDMREWMEEMHESFSTRRGMRYRFQDEELEDLEDGEYERPLNRGFMRRFNSEERD
ncbi:hypothetical protein GCM10008929_02740 [Alkalibacterium psychrotolerans]